MKLFKHAFYVELVLTLFVCFQNNIFLSQKDVLSKNHTFLGSWVPWGDSCLIHSFFWVFCTQLLQPQIFRVSKFKFFAAMQPLIWGYEIDKKLSELSSIRNHTVLNYSKVPNKRTFLLFRTFCYFKEKDSVTASLLKKQNVLNRRVVLLFGTLEYI